MILRCATITLLAALAGCANDPSEIGREPVLTPVGAGVQMQTERHALSALATPDVPVWSGRRGDLFRDQRAARIGDLLTINISINDRASIGNNSGRSRDASVKNSFDAVASLFGLLGSGKGSFDIESSSSTKGQGNIDRSEKIQLSVAAVVTDVLGNGNLLISGSQEIRVNYELRNLTIGGIVRPRDIGRDNMISYDKIAEARVSYGGRGRLMEVQQPGIGQQVYDLVRPF